MAAKSLRKRALDHEEEHDQRIICAISGYRCIYCPMCISGICPHLKRYLETGSWDKNTKCPDEQKKDSQ